MKHTNGSQQATTFFKGTLILTVAGIVVKVIGSLNWIILSRVLGGEGIGLYQMAFPLYLLALSISSAGIPVAISVITAEKLALRDFRGAQLVFRLSLALLFTTGVGLSLLLFFGAGWLIDERVIRDPRAYYSLVALSPAIFLVPILSSFRGYLQGWQIMTPTALSQIIEQLFRVATMLVFASLLLPKGLEYAAGGASLGAGAGAAAGLLVLIYYYRRLPAGLSHEEDTTEITPKSESKVSIINRLARLALPVSLASIMLPLVANLDLLIVPARLEAAGYSVEQATELFGYLTGMAVPLVNLATILTAALATSIVPAISEAYSLGDYKRVFERTGGAMRLANMVTIPGSIALWLLAEPVAGLIYHAPRAGSAIQVLAAGVFLLGVHQVTTGVLQGIGRTAIPVINMGVSAIFKVFLNWTLTAVPSLGIQGAAWATLVDIGIAASLNLYFVYRYTRFYMDVKNLIQSLVAAIVMGGVIFTCFGEVMATTHDNLLATFTGLIFGGIVYGGIMLVIGGIHKRDIERIPRVGVKLANLFRALGLLRV